MTKQISILVSLLLFTLLSSSSALAAANVSIAPPSRSLAPNQTLSLSIGINPNGATVGAAELTFSYDPALLGFVSFTPGAYNLCVGNSDTAGAIKRSCGVAGGISSSASFGTLVLKALKVGSAKVTIGGQVLDSNNTNISAGTTVGTYTIAQPAAPTGQVKSENITASISATPSATPTEITREATTSVSFGTDNETDREKTKVASFVDASFLNKILLTTIGILLIYILHLKGVLKRLLRKN